MCCLCQYIYKSFRGYLPRERPPVTSLVDRYPLKRREHIQDTRYQENGRSLGCVACVLYIFCLSEGTYPWWMLLVAVLLVVLLVSCIYSSLFRGYLSLVDVTGSRSLGCVACVLYIYKTQVFSEGTYPWWMLLVAVLLVVLQDTSNTTKRTATSNIHQGYVPVFSEGTYPWWMLLVAVLLVVLLVSCICSKSFQRVPILGGCYWWPFSWLCCLCLVYISVFSEATLTLENGYQWPSTKVVYPLKRLEYIQDFSEGTLTKVDVTGGRSLGCVACVLYMFPSFQRVPILGGCYWWPFSWLCCLCLVYIQDTSLFRGYLSLVDRYPLVTGRYTTQATQPRERLPVTSTKDSVACVLYMFQVFSEGTLTKRTATSNWYPWLCCLWYMYPSEKTGTYTRLGATQPRCYWWPFSWLCCLCLVYVTSLFRGYLSLVDVTAVTSLGCVACVLYIYKSFQRVPILGGCYW